MMDGRGTHITEPNKKEGGQVIPLRMDSAGPRSIRGGTNGTVVSSVPFPSNFPGEVEGIIPIMSQAKLNEIVAEYSRAIKEAKGRAGSVDELEDGINGILLELASRTDINYSLMVDKLLMAHWTQRSDDGEVAYNRHMQNHVDAIDTLFEGIARELRDRFRGHRKIRILDVSCGTGEVLKRLLDRLPADVLARVQIVANDASNAATDVCRETLHGYEQKVKKIRYTNMDMNRELPDGTYHLVLESQSIEFVSDDRIIRAKRLERTIRQDEEGYDRDAKRNLVSALSDKLVPEKGLLLMVQEDPMMLTKSKTDPEGVITKILFDELFRPIRKEELINDVLKAVPGMKFVCDLQTSIDREHDMYLVVSTRSRKKDARIGTYHSTSSRTTQIPPNGERRSSRDFDVHERNIMQAMDSIYPTLAERLKKFDGNATLLKPITGTRLVIDKKKYADEIENKPNYWRKNGTNDLVIVSGLVHDLGIEGYKRLIDLLNTSGKAKAGTVLLFIDEWPAPRPRGSDPRELGGQDQKVGNSDARKFIFNRPDHTFLASYRSGNKYGYLYVKRDLISAQESSE